jgi:hypothetical protein
MNHKAAVLLFAQKDVTVQKQESMSERISNMSNILSNMSHHVASLGLSHSHL